jgi:hypothetical protein
MMMMKSMTTVAIVALLSGCTPWDEGLVIEDMTGTVVIPRDAATRSIYNAETKISEDVTDVRLIGTVYLGLYPAVLSEDGERPFAYPHPEMGPIIDQGIPGDTYPYGGTSVGDYRFACVESLACKLSTGRFVDYDAIIDWFANFVNDPVKDASGEEVTSGAWLQSACYESLNVTEDAEVRITAYDDRNGDGAIDAGDLDFVENAAGDFVGSFTLWQQEYIDGFSLWGFMDTPSAVTSTFTTCNMEEGFNFNEYNADFKAGAMFGDILNHPSLYLEGGDYVASEGYVYSSVDDTPTINIDWALEQ